VGVNICKTFGVCVAMCLLPLGGCFDNSKNKNIGLQRTVDLATAGNADAQYNLGVLYGRGAWKHFEVPQDYAEAVKWFRLAAEQGHANAQFDLGKLYLHGFDVPEDYAEAYVWFSVAAAGGHADAAGLRDLAYSQLKAVQITLGQKRVAELLKKFGSGKQPEPPVTVDNSAPNKTNGPTSVELPESTNSIGMEFKLIPAGTFIMGDASGEEVLCSDLLTMAKAAKLAGVSRQAVGYWADGLGKGRGKRLKTVVIGTVPHTTAEWLKETMKTGQEANQQEIASLREQVSKMKAALDKLTAEES